MTTPPSKPDRAKQIEEAGKKAVVSFEISEQDVSKFRYDFRAGAEWADANPPTETLAEKVKRLRPGIDAAKENIREEEMDYKAWLLSELAKYPPAPSASDEALLDRFTLVKHLKSENCPGVSVPVIDMIVRSARKGMVPAAEVENLVKLHRLKDLDANAFIPSQVHVALVSEAVRAAAPELARIKFDAGQYLQAYAPDFFDEPEGFTPKLDMNSAALVRRTLLKILNPGSGE